MISKDNNGMPVVDMTHLDHAPTCIQLGYIAGAMDALAIAEAVTRKGATRDRIITGIWDSLADMQPVSLPPLDADITGCRACPAARACYKEA